jgi:hypothetical protein
MSKCEETECLVVEIHKHHSKPFTYIVSNGHNLIGELIEDDITGVLSKKEIKLFYKNGIRKFLVPTNKLKKMITKPKYY